MNKRFQRRSQRSDVRITERDLEIVRAVFEARYLTTQLIARLLFTPTTFSSCKQRTRILFDLGYLGKRRVYPNQPDIYYVGFTGRRYLAKGYGEYDQAQVDQIAGVRGSESDSPHLMMRHELTLSRLYVNARLECDEYGFSMQWKNTRMLELMSLGVQPDAFLAISAREKAQAAFIEFTAAMPTRTELRGKLDAYSQYLESRKCQSDLGVESVAILWFTTSRSKVNRLREEIDRTAYPDYFLVGLIEDGGRFITKPVWCWSEAERRIRWVKPPASAITPDAVGGRGSPEHSQPPQRD
jgi:hypothetical protein